LALGPQCYNLQVHEELDFTDVMFLETALTAYDHEESTKRNNIDQEPTVPKTMKEALTGRYRKNWQDAIDLELHALRLNDTWTEINAPELSNVRPINSKFVFDLKKHSDGSIQRFKARLVARGDMQRDGVDYEHIFSATLRLESLRIILAIAASKDLEIHQMDISNAFLNAECDRDIIMRLPAMGSTRGILVRLNKSLYGLKQAGRLWGQHLKRSFEQLGFVQNDLDTTVYTKGDIVIAVYVDDLVIAARKEEIDTIKSDIKNRYRCTDGGQINWILGLKVVRNREARTITMTQEQYILEVIADLALDNAVALTAPSFAKADEYNSQEVDEKDHEKYRTIIGKVVWISRSTRPDISHIVHLLARNVAAPRKVDMSNLVKLVKYLKGTIQHGLILGGSDIKIMAYCDANFVTPEDPGMFSISGYVFTILGPVSWGSKRQVLLALSTTEAEYIAACLAGKEARWMQLFVESLGIECKIDLRCDNQSAIKLAQDDAFRARTKHIDLTIHWVRWAIQQNYFQIEFIPTKNQLADIFTKVLPGSTHDSIMSRLHILDTTL